MQSILKESVLESLEWNIVLYRILYSEGNIFLVMTLKHSLAILLLKFVRQLLLQLGLCIKSFSQIWLIC